MSPDMSFHQKRKQNLPPNRAKKLTAEFLLPSTYYTRAAT